MKMNLQTKLVFILSIFLSLSLSTLQAQIDLSQDPINGEISFEELEYDFGEITSGEKVTYIYTFTNTGEVPLVLSNAKGSCGCTVPSWPKAPILPGEQGTIEVTFDSSNKSGRQSKRVTITANTNPAQTFLTIRGEVNKIETIKEGKETALTAIEKTNAQIEVNHKNCFAVYPNPTADVLKLDMQENIGKSAIIRIYSPQGKLMKQQNITKIEGVLEFDVSNYTAGTYIANIQIGKHAPIAHCFVVL